MYNFISMRFQNREIHRDKKVNLWLKGAGNEYGISFGHSESVLKLDRANNCTSL